MGAGFPMSTPRTLIKKRTEVLNVTYVIPSRRTRMQSLRCESALATRAATLLAVLTLLSPSIESTAGTGSHTDSQTPLRLTRLRSHPSSCTLSESVQAVDKSVIASQEKLVVSVSECIGIDEWDCAVVDFEIEGSLGEEDASPTSTMSFLLSGAGKDAKSIGSFRLSDDVMDNFGRHRRLTGAWKAARLELDRTGRYRISFRHEGPRRLDGIHNGETMLTNYIPEPFE